MQAKLASLDVLHGNVSSLKVYLIPNLRETKEFIDMIDDTCMMVEQPQTTQAIDSVC